MNFIKSTCEDAQKAIWQGYEKAVAAGAIKAAGGIEAPRAELSKSEEAKGAFFSGFAMRNASAFAMNPKEIAGIIAEHMRLEGTCFERIEIKGPGFINLYSSQRWYEGVLRGIEGEGEG